MIPEQFEDIRSFTTEEIPEAMRLLSEDATAAKIVKLVFGEENFDEARKMLLTIKTSDELQKKILTHCKRWIVSNSMENVETQGFDTIQNGKPYLFTGNHRDITLDAFMLQISMVENGLNSCNIAFGSNLILNKTIEIFSKANKMFKVERSQNIRELAKNSQHLSDYIRYLIKERQSVWIAQRNGRTKDGNDKTDHGIITMFSMSGDRNDLITNLSELNITPVATSYEFEPCAMMKARERYITESDGKYVKKPMEDMDSMISGIWKKKGMMNIAICQSITRDDLNEYEGADKRIVIQAVADLIDKRIYENYRLYPNNFIAYDWLSGTSTFKSHYTEEDKKTFKAYCDKIFSKLYEELGSEAETRFTEILLGIYANPVENKIKNS
ncbi:MAG: 1-acyl-sn-glycerol-3-phosphate acyltransferase [Bacteroidales bacterium]|nr:1-acyl-sn-glycerol-3-phosphate acyltransferase [Bacteroidales bacterium]